LSDSHNGCSFLFDLDGMMIDSGLFIKTHEYGETERRVREYSVKVATLVGSGY